jgi:Tol biopolymer transport system component
MELVEGQPVRQLCEKPLPIEQAVRIGQQIARALAAAHAKGIVHRDIKPENIILRQDGCVKVLDFGLARRVSNAPAHSDASVAGGTLRYMSPEQTRGEPATSASDVFSLGLVLHELINGRHAFPEDTPVETAHAILTKNPSGEMPHNVPEELRWLIRSMLAKAGSERPIAAQVAGQLDGILAILQEPPAARRRGWWIVTLAAVLAVAGVITWLAKSKGDTGDLSDLSIKPLTSQPGWELGPALSPNGDAIAFTWTPTLDGPRQIYVKRDKDSEPKKLAGVQPGQIGYMVWSPDGKRIAFKRGFDRDGAIYWIDSEGGEEQKVLDLANGDLSSAIDWSPDGRLLAFSDLPPGAAAGLVIYLYDIQTGEKRKVTSPPSGIWGDWNPKFSPDGKTIAFKRVTGFWVDDIDLVPTNGGPVQPFTALRHGIWGHTWMPDGRSLLLSCQRSGTVFGIWRFPLRDPARPQRVEQGGLDAITPTTGRRTNRIAWVNQLWDLNVYRIAANGAGRPERVIASTQRDYDPVYAPDGRIAWISDRSGSREVWIAKEDGSEQEQVTHLNGPPVDNLQWSFDGRYLAFDSRPHGYSDIFVLECPPGALRCGEAKAMNVSPAESPGWSADSRSLYFNSDHSGQWQIWKLPLSGGRPVQVAHAAGYQPRESPDGKWIYFSDHRNNSVISRVPGSKAEGQPAGPVPVIGREYKPQYGGWAVTGDELVYVGRPDGTRPAAIRAYNVNTGKVRSILDLTEVFLDRGDISVSVSKDGKSTLYTQLDRSGSNVIVAEKSR